MNTRPVRDPKVTPSRDDRERELARAICAVWDSQTLSDIAAAVGHSANNAHEHFLRYGDPHAKALVDRLEPVYALLWKIEGARVFLQPE